MFGGSMAQSDFIYENQVKSCPTHEWVIASILTWLGIDIVKAKAYCGVSTCKAVLICAVKEFTDHLYPREYQTTGFDRQ
jgi:hypothetical protein